MLLVLVEVEKNIRIVTEEINFLLKKTLYLEKNFFLIKKIFCLFEKKSLKFLMFF